MAVAGWRSSSEQSPDRCLAAIQLRPAAGAQNSCMNCLMTCLQLRESHSSWSLSPGLCLRGCATQVWSSERLLRGKRWGKHYETEKQMFMIHSRHVMDDLGQEPDVKEWERRLLLSQSSPLDTEEWGEEEVSALDAADSLWVTVCLESSSSSSREGQKPLKAEMTRRTVETFTGSRCELSLCNLVLLIVYVVR